MRLDKSDDDDDDDSACFWISEISIHLVKHTRQKTSYT